MKKVGFFHDHRFYKENDQYYTSGTLDKKLWERFLLDDVQHVVVCARYTTDIKEKGTLSSRENVSFSLVDSLSTIKYLLGLADTSKIDQVVASVDYVVVRLPSEIGFYAAKVARKMNKPVACEVVACPWDGLKYYGGIKAKLYAPLLRMKMRKVVAACDAALYVTNYILQQRYPSNMAVQMISASNVEIESIEIDKLNSRINRFIERKNKNALKFGIIGTVKNNTKGIDIAIRAMAGKKHSLHVIGSGDGSTLKKMASDLDVNFFFDGFISDKENVFKWLDDIDVYIQPSFQEGLPRATIEAMSRGCPILSSDAGGLVELTLEQYIHVAGDHSKLSKDINSIINVEDIHSLIEHSYTTSEKYKNTRLKSIRENHYSSFYKV